jgi:tetratricopeptide (TPR) repeat protein
MSIEYAFLLYASVYRLAVIAAGVCFVYFGYKLFSQNARVRKSEESISVKSEALSIALKNLAPGTAFSLFGSVVISLMIWQGGPSLMLETLQKATGSVDEKPTFPTRLTLRSENGSNDLKSALELENGGKTEQAIAAYTRLLEQQAAPMNNLAWLLLKTKKTHEALALAALASQLSPFKPEYLDTYAEALCRVGKPSEALPVIERAVAMDSRFSERAQYVRKGCN